MWQGGLIRPVVRWSGVSLSEGVAIDFYSYISLSAVYRWTYQECAPTSTLDVPFQFIIQCHFLFFIRCIYGVPPRCRCSIAPLWFRQTEVYLSFTKLNSSLGTCFCTTCLVLFLRATGCFNSFCQSRELLLCLIAIGTEIVSSNHKIFYYSLLQHALVLSLCKLAST